MIKLESNENIIGVIQARLDSSRLPGKVLSDILGKPMILHLVNRLKHSTMLSNVVIATTNRDEDKPLCEFADSEGISYYAGSENDIADRLYQTGKMFDATAIVKVNGDCPLIDSSLIDNAVKNYLSLFPRPDLVTNSVVRTFPEGMQYGLFNLKTLSEICKTLKDKFWREFVHMYIIENKKRFSVINIENKIDLSILRWSVDYLEDLEFVRQVYENIYPNNNFFEIADILSLLEKKPEIKTINKKYTSDLSLKLYEKLKNQSTK